MADYQIYYLYIKTHNFQLMSKEEHSKYGRLGALKRWHPELLEKEII